nr:zinc finger BED domain-containing protein RICESLEEPER 2-like [Ipomoea batatas]
MESSNPNEQTQVHDIREYDLDEADFNDDNDECENVVNLDVNCDSVGNENLDVADVGDEKVFKVNLPQFEKISRAMAKNDVITVYDIEKKKLQSLLKTINKISLTTDIWKSKVQKISYMCVTGHFVDSNWKLQKRLLSFMPLPPPHTGVDIIDGVLKSTKDWGIEHKVFTISVDNASNNDVAVRIAKETFSRSHKLPLSGKVVLSGLSLYDKYLDSVEDATPNKSELDIYLEEGVYRCQDGEVASIFDALAWWKSHELKFSILSKLARDVLSIPISTVASEATFSAGTRVLDPYRAKLSSDMVQVLICGADWVRQLHGINKPIMTHVSSIFVI